MSDHLIEKLLAIAQKRRKVLEEMREAVRLGDKDRVFVLARKLTGSKDEKRHRVNPGLN
jgi:hypothetical protein